MSQGAGDDGGSSSEKGHGETCPESPPNGTNGTGDLTDEEVVRKFRKYQDEMIRRGQAPARRVAGSILRRYPSLVDDAVQETLIRIFRFLDRYDGRGPFGAWIRSIARNVALSMLRKLRSGPRLDTDVDPLIERTPDPALLPDSALSARRKLALLDKLPESQRDTLLLTGLGMTAGEIATQLDVPGNTVLRRRQLGRMKLRRFFEDLEGPRPIPQSS